MKSELINDIRPGIKETSSNDKLKEENEENEKIEMSNLIYGLIFIIIIALLGYINE